MGGMGFTIGVLLGWRVKVSLRMGLEMRGGRGRGVLPLELGRIGDWRRGKLGFSGGRRKLVLRSSRRRRE